MGKSRVRRWAAPMLAAAIMIVASLVAVGYVAGIHGPLGRDLPVPLVSGMARWLGDKFPAKGAGAASAARTAAVTSPAAPGSPAAPQLVGGSSSGFDILSVTRASTPVERTLTALLPVSGSLPVSAPVVFPVAADYEGSRVLAAIPFPLYSPPVGPVVAKPLSAESAPSPASGSGTGEAQVPASSSGDGTAVAESGAGTSRLPNLPATKEVTHPQTQRPSHVAAARESRARTTVKAAIPEATSSKAPAIGSRAASRSTSVTQPRKSTAKAVSHPAIHRSHSSPGVSPVQKDTVHVAPAPSHKGEAADSSAGNGAR